MSIWIERHTPLRGDIYLMRRRAGHAQVILNDAYRGLRVVDPWDGSEVARVPFSEQFRQGGGAVALLYVRADGLQALAADFEGPCGALMDLTGGAPTDVLMPPSGDARSAAHVWDERGLVCADTRLERFYEMEAGRLSKASSLQVRKARPGWRRALHENTFPSGSVARVYNDERAAVTYHRAQAQSGVRVMRASWEESLSWGSPERDRVDDVAALPEDLFSLSRNVVWRHTFGHEPEVFMRPPPGWEVRGVETLAGDGVRPPALLTLLCHSVDLFDLRLALTPLEGRPEFVDVGQHSVEVVGQGMSSLVDGLRRASQRAGSTGVAALLIRNTGHMLFKVSRDGLERALRAVWGQRSIEWLDGLRAVRVFNGRGAHDFDTASFLESP